MEHQSSLLCSEKSSDGPYSDEMNSLHTPLTLYHEDSF
jgi:hypothetical protein